MRSMTVLFGGITCDPDDRNYDEGGSRGFYKFLCFGGRRNRNSEVRNSDTFRVPVLTLRPSGYDWSFMPEAGKTFRDSGAGLCHGFMTR